MDTDLNDTLDIPTGPLPEVTHGARGRSDALLPPAKDAQIMPVTTGITMSDRFKELPKPRKVTKPRPEVVPADREVREPPPITTNTTLPIQTMLAYSRAIKSMKRYGTSHMEEMTALRQEQRRRMMEAQQIRMGNTKVIGARGTGLIGSINHLNTVIRNRTQAQMSGQIRTARSLNLRLGVRGEHSFQGPLNSNRSAFRVDKSGIMRARDRLRGRRFPQNGQGAGNSAPAWKKKPNDNRFKFHWDDASISKDDLDQSMLKAKQNNKQHLDKELEEYMAAAAAAKMNKSSSTPSEAEMNFEATVNDNEDTQDQDTDDAAVKLTIDDDSKTKKKDGIMEPKQRKPNGRPMFGVGEYRREPVFPGPGIGHGRPIYNRGLDDDDLDYCTGELFTSSPFLTIFRGRDAQNLVRLLLIT